MSPAVAAAIAAPAPAPTRHAAATPAGADARFASLLDSLGGGEADCGPHASQDRRADDARRAPSDRKPGLARAATEPAAASDVAALAAALAQAVAPIASAAPSATQPAPADPRAVAGAPARPDRRALAAGLEAAGETACAATTATAATTPSPLAGLKVSGKRTFLAALDAARGADVKPVAAAMQEPSVATEPAQTGEPDGGGRPGSSPAAKRETATPRSGEPQSRSTGAPTGPAPNSPPNAGVATQAAPAASVVPSAAIPARDLPAVAASQAQSLVRAAPVDPSASNAVGARGAVKQIDLQLDPRDLGAVSMTLRLTGDALSVVIKVANARAQSAIESERTAIAARLGTVDQPLASLTIERADATPSDSETSDAAQRDASDPGRRQAEPQTFGGDGAAPRRRDEPAHAQGGARRSGRGDYFV